MGDRTNTVFRMADGSDIVLYQHWGGENMLAHLAAALNAAEARWDDESYCTRIVISDLIGDNWSRGTGYGLNTRIMDNEHSVPVLDFSDNTVALYDYQFMSHGCELRDQKFRMPFGEFVKRFSKVLTTA
jgi:hypothetical protein